MIAGIFLSVTASSRSSHRSSDRATGRGLVALIGVLSVSAGLVLVERPFDTLVVFALIVGAWFVVAGIARLIAGFAERDGRGGNLLIAAIDVVAGIVILGVADLGLSTFAVILGIVLIIRGLLFVFAGWQLRAASIATSIAAQPDRGAQARRASSAGDEGRDDLVDRRPRRQRRDQVVDDRVGPRRGPHLLVGAVLDRVGDEARAATPAGRAPAPGRRRPPRRRSRRRRPPAAPAARS